VERDDVSVWFRDQLADIAEDAAQHIGSADASGAEVA
jgi:hypothetical protein